jgi:3-methylcrotonyl-CoA carboxylase alpha subunit
MSEPVRQIRRLFIANRGEIAVRIARTCHELGIASVAVYSEADRRALHVRSCTEAHPLGGATPAESYLRGDKIIEIARQAECDAIHPGYGFLSENVNFARKVAEAGIIWVGPPPEAIHLMGSKIESKRLAQRAGVPVVPGYFEDDQSLETLLAEAQKIGYPLLVKASAGGGGKGMRIVNAQSELTEQLAGAQREAQAAFGDSAVMLEKYLTRPRHIEVQVLGDHHGNLVHLYERECSIQRRHQKVIEECPSPALDEETRERITSAALALAREAGYTNAGTVEFIFQDGDFYFLEMNTRLQVEHPVTEEALDLDLVALQLSVAAGEPLPFSQADVTLKKHSIEARLYAEDPAHGFLPQTGTITELELELWHGELDTRVDSGVEAGDHVTPYYDPMLAKLIGTGDDRRAALGALASLLGTSRVEGVTTNLEFLRWLVNHPEFAGGDLSTRFIENNYTAGPQHSLDPTVVARLAARLNEGESGDTFGHRDVWEQGAWRLSGVGRPLRFLADGIEYSAEISSDPRNRGEKATIRRGDEIIFEGPIAPGYSAGEKSYEVTAHGWTSVLEDGRLYTARFAPPLTTARMNPDLRLKGDDSLESPMPGTLLKLNVAVGEQVEEGQALAVVEAMKMEFTVRAPHAGRVKAVNYSQGDQVAAGDVLIALTEGSTQDG